MQQSRTCFQAATNQFNKFHRMNVYPFGRVTLASRIHRWTGLQGRLQNPFLEGTSISRPHGLKLQIKLRTATTERIP